jgi:hypothetical protein
MVTEVTMIKAGGGISQIDELMLKLNALPDPAAHAVAVELVQAVMSLHAAALDRILEIVAALAPEVIKELGADDLVSRMLVLHGVHPDDFPTRLGRAIDELQCFFDSRGAGIQVLEAGPERIRVRVNGSRPGSRPAAREAIEDVIYETVPEVGELIVEGAEEEHGAGFVPLASLLAPQHL